jgi:hypothetical protein
MTSCCSMHQDDLGLLVALLKVKAAAGYPATSPEPTKHHSVTFAA